MKGFSKSAVALVLLAVAGAASADALSDCYKTAVNRVQVRQCLQKELDRTAARLRGHPGCCEGSGEAA
ncbi:MAG: hypothetical protein V8S69_05040 [Dakarella massiliensis]